MSAFGPKRTWRRSPQPTDLLTPRAIRTSAAAMSVQPGCLENSGPPRVVAEMNDYQFKIVKIEGDFVWHNHPETHETFLVLEGELRIDFRDRAVNGGPGELFVLPRGVEHKPFAAKEVKMMLTQPRGVLNTGHAGGARTVQNDIWI